MRSPDFLWTAERAADWRQPWDGYTMTRYGRKAEREGRVAAYLRFRRSGLARHSGACDARTLVRDCTPGISRFRVRFAPRNDDR